MKRLLVLAVAAAVSVCAFAGPYCWKVSDGDTIWVREGKKKTKIRMVDIDAPEMNQPFGPEAADALAAMVLGKEVRIESTGKDRYGRSLDRVFVADGTNTVVDVNLKMVEKGMAWVYYSCKRDDYKKAESAAKAKRLGLWADPKPFNPYDWRKQNHPAAPDREYNKRKAKPPAK